MEQLFEAPELGTTTLLITAAGTGVGWGYALTLAQQFPQVRLITADTNAKAWVSASLMAEDHIQWPLFTADESYLDRLNTALCEYGVTHYLPIIDPEIVFATHNRERIQANVIAVDAPFARFASAKHEYESVLGAFDIYTPRTLTAQDIAEGRHGFAKLTGSFGGRAVWPVTRLEDLDTLPGGYFLQEALDGPEFTADCFPTGDSDIVFCSVRERLETKSGVCTKARINSHPVMEKYARQLVLHFGIKQPFCFQAIGTERLAVTDINARLGAGTMMSVANGSDFFGAHLAQAFGHSWRERLNRHLTRCAITRQYVELVSHEP